MVFVLGQREVEFLKFANDHAVVFLAELAEDFLIILDDGNLFAFTQRDQLLVGLIPFLFGGDIDLCDMLAFETKGLHREGCAKAIAGGLAFLVLEHALILKDSKLNGA